MSNVPYNASRLTKVTIKGSVGWWRIYQETGSCHFNISKLLSLLLFFFCYLYHKLYVPSGKNDVA
jgi:hypothetical protein